MSEARPPQSSASPPAWKERAHGRSLAPARQRVDAQLARLVRAAQDMVYAGEEVTVPALVARAGMSTKTFYRHFVSRDEILFAVLEEELAVGARAIDNALVGRSDPIERLRVFIEAYLGLPRGYASAEVRQMRIQEGQRLRAVDAERSAEAAAPLHSALEGIINELGSAGRLEGRDVVLTTRSILHVLNGHLVDLAYAASTEDQTRLARHAVTVCFGMLGLSSAP